MLENAKFYSFTRTIDTFPIRKPKPSSATRRNTQRFRPCKLRLTQREKGVGESDLLKAFEWQHGRARERYPVAFVRSSGANLPSFGLERKKPILACVCSILGMPSPLFEIRALLNEHASECNLSTLSMIFATSTSYDVVHTMGQCFQGIYAHPIAVGMFSTRNRVGLCCGGRGGSPRVFQELRQRF